MLMGMSFLRNGRLAAAATMIVGALVVAAACGGSSSNDLSTTPPGDAGGGAPSDGGTAADPYTLDNVCQRTGPVICDIIKSCCSAGAGYDQAGCLAHAKADCEKDVAEARAGRETFHPERVDTCIPKYRDVYKSCNLTLPILQGALKDIAKCQIFTGQLAEGAPCTRGAECKEAPGANVFVSCSDDTKSCHATTIAEEGDRCTLTGNLAILCSGGLYCDAIGEDGGVHDGTCKKVTPLDSPCSKVLECGLGNYCAKATKTCTPGKGGGAACQDSLECASVSCVKAAGAAAGTCKAINPLAKPEECKGP
jgi:hypothetical protein